MLDPRRVLQASIYMTTWLIAALLARPAPAIQVPGSEAPRMDLGISIP